MPDADLPYDVFLSFASDDKEAARDIYRILTLGGLEVFWSPEGLKGWVGTGWRKAIEESLLKSRHFLLLWTTKAKDSKWVDHECDAFFRECHIKDPNIRRLVILLDGSEPSSSLPPFLGSLQIAGSAEEVATCLGGINLQRKRYLERLETALARVKQLITVRLDKIPIRESELILSKFEALDAEGQAQQLVVDAFHHLSKTGNQRPAPTVRTGSPPHFVQQRQSGPQEKESSSSGAVAAANRSPKSGQATGTVLPDLSQLGSKASELSSMLGRGPRQIEPLESHRHRRRIGWWASVVAAAVLVGSTCSYFLLLAQKQEHLPAEPAGGVVLEGLNDIRLRFVPGGTYMVGSPELEPHRGRDETRHTVTVTKGFWLAETELTQAQWKRALPWQPISFPECGGTCPVDSVNWYEAVGFANQLSRKEGFASCYHLEGCKGALGVGDYTCDSATFAGFDCTGYRLPSEAEWEIAARAGTTNPIYGGSLVYRGKSSFFKLNPIAWYSENNDVRYKGGLGCRESSGEPHRSRLCGPHPVGQKLANAWGFSDMLGNVWEWTGDWYSEYPATKVSDPLGPRQGTLRVTRGGAWFGDAKRVRAASRNRIEPSLRYPNLGFRLARGQ